MVRVTEIKQLALLAMDRRSVCDGRSDRRMPADVVMNMQGWGIMNWMNSGMFVYEPRGRHSAFERKVG